MARIPRVTAIPFGSGGTTDDFETFGSTAVGSTDYSKDIAAIQATGAWLSGWRAALVASKAPVLQDMNGKMLVDSNLLCYLFQEGTPEYDSGTTYYVGSVVKNLANSGYIEFYASLVVNNVGNALGTRVSNGNWMFLYAMNTTNQGLIIPGTNTNDAAATGKVGEYVESVLGNTNYPGPTANILDLTSISLTPGDWDVTGMAAFIKNGATFTVVQTLIGITTTPGNSSTGLNFGQNAVDDDTIAPTNFVIRTVSVPSYRMSLAAPTTVYLKATLANYTAGQPLYTCRLSARRMR